MVFPGLMQSFSKEKKTNLQCRLAPSVMDFDTCDLRKYQRPKVYLPSCLQWKTFNIEYRLLGYLQDDVCLLSQS